MYESETYEVILRRMLNRVLAKFDKREGSMVFNGSAPSAVEVQNLYIVLDAVLKEVFIDTASREFLIKHGKHRALSPKPASYALVRGQFTPTTLEIPIGSRFSHEDFNYMITEKIADGTYYLTCETVGSEANGVTGQLIPIDYIPGLETANIVEVSILGEDEEDTETFRNRLLGAYQAEAYGGNQIDYITKIRSISGVGGLKLYCGADWNGYGTVLLVIKDSDNGVPTDDFITKLQTDIDPVTNRGQGVGIAPIGHFVTIVPANNTVVNIETVLVYGSTANWESVKSNVQAAVDSYLGELNAEWNYDSAPIVVRVSHIESKLLAIPGILDVHSTKINGSTDNLSVDKNSLVTRGTINGE